MLNNKGTITITTERLILRKFNLNDIGDFYNNVGNDAEVSKYVVWNRHENINVTSEYINKCISDYEKDYVYNWVIELKDIHKVIGSISCVKVDVKNETCEVGYVLSSKYWNKGYMTETLKSVINYLMNDEGYKTIYANHLGANKASGRVMEKSGMQFEGILRNRMIDKNTLKYDNLYSYSITKID